MRPVVTIRETTKAELLGKFGEEIEVPSNYVYDGYCLSGWTTIPGGEMEIEQGKGRYHFSRFEHRECRLFVEQKSGVLS